MKAAALLVLAISFAVDNRPSGVTFKILMEEKFFLYASKITTASNPKNIHASLSLTPSGISLLEKYRVSRVSFHFYFGYLSYCMVIPLVRDSSNPSSVGCTIATNHYPMAVLREKTLPIMVCLLADKEQEQLKLCFNGEVKVT